MQWWKVTKYILYIQVLLGYNFEVLYFSISILSYFILLLHHFLLLYIYLQLKKLQVIKCRCCKLNTVSVEEQEVTF